MLLMMAYKMQIIYQTTIFILLFTIIFTQFNCINAQKPGGNGLYSRRYEKIDMDTILANPRLVTNYVDCLLNKRPCPPEGKDLKRILPEALRTKCGRCWPSQKEGALKVITKLYYDYPQHYSALREKWDPTGEYHRRFEEYLIDQNFNLISNNDDDGRDEPIIFQPPLPISTTTTTRTTTTTTPSPVIPLQQQQPERFIPQNAIDQRPTRQDVNGQGIPDNSFISNRFGDEANEFDDMVLKTQPQRTPAPTVRSSPKITTSRTSLYNNPQQQYGGSATVNIFKTQNPILNFINRLTTKFQTTAEILAGMLRGNTQVKVNVGGAGGNTGGIGTSSGH